MSLASEIAEDLFSDDLVEDLVEEVKWNAITVLALVSVVGVEEGMDDFGGSVFSAQREFKFRRKELEGRADDLVMHGDTLIYNSKTYDVTAVDERPEWPVISVIGTLRE